MESFFGWEISPHKCASVLRSSAGRPPAAPTGSPARQSTGALSWPSEMRRPAPSKTRLSGNSSMRKKSTSFRIFDATKKVRQVRFVEIHGKKLNPSSIYVHVSFGVSKHYLSVPLLRGRVLWRGRGPLGPGSWRRRRGRNGGNVGLRRGRAKETILWKK